MNNADVIVVKIVDGVGVVTLNRPEARNAVNELLYRGMVGAVRNLNADSDVRAVVLNAAGPVFSAGADIKEQFDADPEVGATVPEWTEWVGLVRSCKPVVAAVDGAAVGMGFTMLLPCDRIIVTPRAKLTMPFLQLGLVPEMGATALLPRRVGFSVATELLLSGRAVAGDEAVRIGLADEVVEPDDLVEVALVRARQLGGPAPQTRWTKQLLDDHWGATDLAAVQRREMEVLTRALRTAEHAQAVRSFLQKRST